MFECSLYGISRGILEWKGEHFKRTEKIYLKNNKKAFISTETYYNKNSSTYITIREIPDKNKIRSSVVCRCNKLIPDEDNAVNNSVHILETIGFDYIKTNIVQGIKYLRNGYYIELTKILKEEDIVDSSDEEDYNGKEFNATSKMLIFYLVKVYVLSEDPTEGEKILENAMMDFEGIIKIVKPDLACF